MYKVFIHNKPLSFIKNEKNGSFEGIFISSGLSRSNREYVLSLLKDLAEDVPIFILSNSPEKEIIEFFSDHIFVEAAGGIVVKDTTYLFIKRHGIWDIPKGKIDEGETPEVTAVREIEEECGINCKKVNKLIDISYHTYLFKGIPTLKKTYWYELSYKGNEVLTPQEEEGISDVKWLTRHEVDTMVRKETYTSIQEVLDTYFYPR